ncbi:MAG: 4Fe-4S dicluster domain-containing protein, partial [bacterium]
DPFYDMVFDVSVGYDLKGISSPPVRRWLQNMQDAGDAIEAMLAALPPKFAAFKKLPVPTCLADSVTLSTFHGCPRDEIEAIVQHLIREHHFHVIVKMNPTILGYDFVRHTLQNDLGYEHIALDPAAFENDLQFDEGVAMMKRLVAFAGKHNRNVGAKFTNTLVVKNREKVFDDEVQYLSGPPLHVLAMHAMQRFRRALGDDFHISFSAGVTKHNFAEAVRCNMKPITTCTDLLKTGGYTRLFDYLLNLKAAMEKCECRTIDAFIIKSAEQESGKDRHAAGMANAERLIPQLVENPRYHYHKNRKAPPKIDSRLALFDCITCNKCLPVCPNAANFSIPTGTMDIPITHFRIENGAFVGVENGAFQLQKTHQIANLADFCNECGDCDTYCPEHGGPFVAKPRFFFSRESFEKDKNQNGFFFETPAHLLGCIDGQDYALSLDPATGQYTYKSEAATLTLGAGHELIAAQAAALDLPEGTEIDLTPYYAMRVLLNGLLEHPEMYAAVVLRKNEMHK